MRDLWAPRSVLCPSLLRPGCHAFSHQYRVIQLTKFAHALAVGSLPPFPTSKFSNKDLFHPRSPGRHCNCLAVDAGRSARADRRADRPARGVLLHRHPNLTAYNVACRRRTARASQ